MAFTSKSYKHLLKMMESEKLAKRLDYLYRRWQDEHKYEDWSDYETEMKKSWGMDGFIKGYKRPFGFLVKDTEHPVQYRIKLSFSKTHVRLGADVVQLKR